jgi:hypothetical protein
MNSSKPRASETGTQISVRLQAPELAALDAWRKEQPDLPSRPEAIRRLVAQVLNPPEAGQSLEDLFRAFLSTGGTDRLEQYGFEDDVTLDHAIELEFRAKRGQRGELGEVQYLAGKALDIFVDETDPAAVAICNLLKPLAKIP